VTQDLVDLLKIHTLLEDAFDVITTFKKLRLNLHGSYGDKVRCLDFLMARLKSYLLYLKNRRVRRGERKPHLVTI
jgi:hypothetical protein